MVRHPEVEGVLPCAAETKTPGHFPNPRMYTNYTKGLYFPETLASLYCHLHSGFDTL